MRAFSIIFYSGEKTDQLHCPRENQELPQAESYQYDLLTILIRTFCSCYINSHEKFSP